MTWGAVASAGASLLGGMMASSAAEDSSKRQAAVSAEQAAALKDAAKWKAIGTTNRYGSSAQTVDAEGNLTATSWNMSPEMKAYQDRLQNGAGQALPTNFDPEAATQAQYQLLKNQQAPGVEQGYSGLMSNLMGKGTLGLATGGTEGLGGGLQLMQSNPQMAAFMNAVAQQDAANLTAAQAQSRSMMDSDINRSNGLMSQVGTIEGQGQTSLNNTMNWGTNQQSARLTGAGAVATQNNLSAQQLAAGDSGSMLGSVLQGVGSNPAFGRAIDGMFGTKTTPASTASPYDVTVPTSAPPAPSSW